MSNKVPSTDDSLCDLIRKAADRIASATTEAEILEARERATFAYNAAKTAARLSMAKRAHDEIIAKLRRAQADALEIEAGAKRRLADEYDGAKERGEVQKAGGARNFIIRYQNNEPIGSDLPIVSDLGLTSKDIFEARKIRDAEAVDPGIVRRHLDKQLAEGWEPSRASLMREIEAASVPRREIHIVQVQFQPSEQREIVIPLSYAHSVCAQDVQPEAEPQPKHAFPEDSLEAELLRHFPADLLRRERAGIEAAVQSIAASLESIIHTRVEKCAAELAAKAGTTDGKRKPAGRNKRPFDKLD